MIKSFVWSSLERKAKVSKKFFVQLQSNELSCSDRELVLLMSQSCIWSMTYIFSDWTEEHHNKKKNGLS